MLDVIQKYIYECLSHNLLRSFVRPVTTVVCIVSISHVHVYEGMFILYFKGMSLLIYVGALMAIFYYLGITQLAASKLAWGMSVCMGTTAIETLGVASNIMLNGVSYKSYKTQFVTSLLVVHLFCAVLLLSSWNSANK